MNKKEHICNSCISIDKLIPGDKGIISFIDGGRWIISKLKKVGIVPGSKVEVVSGIRHKKIKTDIGETEIGKGMSNKIFIRPDGDLKIKCLSLCSTGDRVKIKRVFGYGLFKKRLSEMGFIAGAELEIVKYAPLKDPLELIIQGYHVSLRINEADNILVEGIE